MTKNDPISINALSKVFEQATKQVVEHGGSASVTFSPSEKATKARLTPTKKENTQDILSAIFCLATKEILEATSGATITFSPTAQKVPKVRLRPDIACFVQFDGDYTGLLVMNFSGEAALELYREYMLAMGFQENELAIEFTSDEVVDNIGELINQIIGNARKKIEERFGLVAHNNQPKAIAIMSPITLSIDTYVKIHNDQCRRLSLRVNSKPFQIELAVEETEFLDLNLDEMDLHLPKEVHILSE